MTTDLPITDTATANKYLRLIKLYFLGVAITEPYRYIIFKMLEFFDIDDSKNADFDGMGGCKVSERYNKKGDYLFSILNQPYGRIDLGTGESYKKLTTSLYLLENTLGVYDIHFISIHLLYHKLGFEFDSFEY